jgi:hypothetical protein
VVNWDTQPNTRAVLLALDPVLCELAFARRINFVRDAIQSVIAFCAVTNQKVPEHAMVIDWQEQLVFIDHPTPVDKMRWYQVITQMLFIKNQGGSP